MRRRFLITQSPKLRKLKTKSTMIQVTISQKYFTERKCATSDIHTRTFYLGFMVRVEAKLRC